MIGKAIDSTADQADAAINAAETVAPQSAQRKPPRARGVGFALFIAALALFFTVIGIAAGYKHWQRMHDRAKDNARRIEVMETALASKMDSRDLAALMTMPVNDVTVVSAKVNLLLTQLPSRAELIQTATDSMRNDGGSVAASHRTVTPVAKTVAAFDTGLANDALADSASDSFWSVCKQRALALLSHFVSVRKIEPSVAATLRVEEQEALHSLIRLRLESLRLMALQGDKQAYQQQLALLRSTLGESAYYSPEQLAVWQAALDELAAVDLQSKQHDITDGLRQLRQSQQENLVGAGQ